jgi:GH25 family lysozyme M1 (1,4-beta-N-acetylmuramidase)
MLRTRARHRQFGLLSAFVTLIVTIFATPAWASLTGPDVSNWQHPNGAAINWQTVRQSGNEFAFIKATEGPGPRNGQKWYTNPYFAADWRDAGAAGLARGAYHYAQPAKPTTTTAVDQARYYVSQTGTMHGKRDLPPVLDLEESNGLSPSDLLAWAQAWLQEVQRLTGRQPIIYTYLNFWQVQMANTTALSNYKLWFARYTSDPSQTTPPGGWQTWTFWQYTSSGQVPGITGSVDMSRFCCALTNLNALANGAAASAAASNPFGSWDHSVRQPGGVMVQGWAIDPDTTNAVQVHAYVDGSLVQPITADAPSPDVSRSYPGFGNNHRFNTVVSSVGGSHKVCLYAINQGYGSGNPPLDCRQLYLSSTPFGHLDVVKQTPKGVAVQGWSIDPDTADPVMVHVYLDGVPVQAISANDSRPDVAARYPGYGSTHGFSTALPITSAGLHTVCAYAINLIGKSINPQLGCLKINVTTAPIGHLDGVDVTSSGMSVHGWALDPTTASAIPVHVYVDGTLVKGALADDNRPDVGALFPGYGAAHGFGVTLPAPTAGPHQVCVYAIAQTPGAVNPRLGCLSTG